MRANCYFSGRLLALVAAAFLAGACSGDPPLTPTPPSPPPPIQEPPPPPPPPPPLNTPPVISSVTASATRAEINAAVEINTMVTDAESAIDTLTFEWSADGGTFTGTGPRTSWNPPAGPTPATYRITVTVVEKYPTLGSDGTIVTAEHRIKGSSVEIRVHDSPTELAEMGLRFLGYFTDSARSPDACVVDFSDSCIGKAHELGDITRNRAHYQILDWSLGTPRVSYSAGDTTADMLIRTAITSRIINCGGMPEPCVVGSLQSVLFDGYLAAVYEEGRWWLCASNALEPANASPATLRFLGLQAN